MAYHPDFPCTPSVVCVIFQPIPNGPIVAVRRGNPKEPGYGLLALPGGYQGPDETWQQAGARELHEETGLVVDTAGFKLLTVITDKYKNNVFIALCSGQPPVLRAPAGGEAGEVLEVVPVSAVDIAEWAFPLHAAAAEYCLRGQGLPAPW